MADEDEIDVLGEFSFNSCLAQNNQGIPSCSDREDTVHPQWLLDSTASNWYDKEKDIVRIATPLRIENSPPLKETKWKQHEREILVREMAKYGHNIHKIANTLKTKTEAEIQMLIDTEYGVQLDVPRIGFIKSDDCLETPPVAQEEVVTDEVFHKNTISKSTARNQTKLNSKSLLKPNILPEIKATDSILNSAEIFYEDDMIIGSTELIGDEEPNISLEIKPLHKKVLTKTRRKNIKHLSNHRTKKNKVDKVIERAKHRSRSRDIIKSPATRYQKDSLSIEDTNQSPKMQIVLGSGKALPLSEGEKVIKIEKKKESDSDSEIDIDVDSDDESNQSKRTNSIRSISESDYNSANDLPGTPENIRKYDALESVSLDPKDNNMKEEPIAVPLRKFMPQPRRQKKINLDGGGGYTITHTESGDLYEYGAEPKRERQPRKQPIELMQCRFYNKDKPAPYAVELDVSTLLCMDSHAHSSRGEVMGLVGGSQDSQGGGTVSLSVYRPVDALSSTTHCDMDPVSQQMAASAIETLGLSVVCWHHSHPTFPATPSRQDVTSQRAMQLAFERNDTPMLAIITSQQRATGRSATHYRCFRVECCPLTHEDVGYVLSVRLRRDVALEDIRTLAQRLGQLLRSGTGELAIQVDTDVCPHAGTTYLEKCILSIRQHMRSAGYEDDDPVVKELIQSLKDIFR